MSSTSSARKGKVAAHAGGGGSVSATESIPEEAPAGSTSASSSGGGAASSAYALTSAQALEVLCNEVKHICILKTEFVLQPNWPAFAQYVAAIPRTELEELSAELSSEHPEAWDCYVRGADVEKLTRRLLGSAYSQHYQDKDAASAALLVASNSSTSHSVLAASPSPVLPQRMVTVDQHKLEVKLFEHLSKLPPGLNATFGKLCHAVVGTSSLLQAGTPVQALSCFSLIRYLRETEKDSIVDVSSSNIPLSCISSGTTQGIRRFRPSLGTSSVPESVLCEYLSKQKDKVSLQELLQALKVQEPGPKVSVVHLQSITAELYELIHSMEDDKSSLAALSTPGTPGAGAELYAADVGSFPDTDASDLDLPDLAKHLARVVGTPKYRALRQVILQAGGYLVQTYGNSRSDPAPQSPAYCFRAVLAPLLHGWCIQQAAHDLDIGLTEASLAELYAQPTFAAMKESPSGGYLKVDKVPFNLINALDLLRRVCHPGCQSSLSILESPFSSLADIFGTGVIMPGEERPPKLPKGPKADAEATPAAGGGNSAAGGGAPRATPPRDAALTPPSKYSSEQSAQKFQTWISWSICPGTCSPMRKHPTLCVCAWHRDAAGKAQYTGATGHLISKA